MCFYTEFYKNRITRVNTSDFVKDVVIWSFQIFSCSLAILAISVLWIISSLEPALFGRSNSETINNFFFTESHVIWNLAKYISGKVSSLSTNGMRYFDSFNCYSIYIFFFSVSPPFNVD